ncbi:FecR family protein [Rhodocytophaga rosea]|uniref:FecR family protein n=1 Tax=Rhodocytophaga rosea TaxID=2704465 RepID=A0A6C0GMH0_9BACT|nr:FecR family protein [Rhodocytophaga rosea]QHT69238.1 FecR family protein [Rhodocytophaga rosea]
MRYYQHYTVEDLSLDAHFRKWVNHPTSGQDSEWEQWMNEYPDKRSMVEQARIIVLSLQTQEPLEIDDETLQQEINKIFLLTEEKPLTPQKTHKTAQVHSFGYLFIRVAASVVILLSIGWWYWQYKPLADQPAKLTRTIPTQTASAQIEHVNRGTEPMLINLPDKSTVLLQENSRIYYASIFNDSIREVHLEGEAFFEVAKDPKRPFYVYTDEITTRVVGTSFHVKANPADNNISVIVKTGRVSVFTNTDQKKTMAKDSSGLVLTPNEQLIYQKADKQITQTVVKPIEIRRLAIPENNFVFHQTPVSQVFSRLEENYNVDIEYTVTQLRNCDLTASFTDEPFAVKLDLICGAIGVSYQMEGNRIIIQGTGCIE